MPAATKSPKLDSVLVAAADLARQALVDEMGADEVGEHLDVVAESDRLVTHRFASTRAAHTGWHWAVTVARAPRQKVATVDEMVLLPGDAAVLAPPWLPWKDRVAKEDLGPGDLVPITDDDPRLVPGYLVGDAALDASTARDVREVTRELGLGRERVLSVIGRDEAADRWYGGESGPAAPMAQAAPAHCATCGFLVRLSGPLGTMFGLCSNASSPSDSQAVSYDHGCGAHSDVRLEQSQHQPAAAAPVHDTLNWDSWGETDLEPIDR
ncbi:MAG: DUF3027 domain-containing protein [Nocardioidaceae bacterium]